MRKYATIALKLTGGLVGLTLVAWLGITVYVYSNKEELLTTITTQLNENLNGTLTIESMEPELIRGFPGISVSLKNVLLRDSLWEDHQHDLLKAKDVYIAVDALSLLAGPPRIKKISVAGGKVYLYTDSLGYSNTSLFKNRNAEKDSIGDDTKNKVRINSIDFSNVSFIHENRLKNKYFNFNISNFAGNIKYNAKGWKATADLNTLINQFQLNTRRGSFLENKHLQITGLKLEFDDKTKKLTIHDRNISIENDDFQVGGTFTFADNSSGFKLDIKAENVLFSKAADLLLPHITRKLNRYHLEKPIAAQATISGELKGRGKQPLIHVTWQVKNNTLKADNEVIENCTFNGSFTNQVLKGQSRTDMNSAITFNKMSGTWYAIDFYSEAIRINNLKRPVIEGKFTADFALKKLNTISGGKTFHFDDGTAKLDLLYKAPFSQSDADASTYILGTISINNAAATYRPRNLKFNKTSLILNFKGHDLLIQNMQVNSGNTKLYMNASLRNFLNLYYTDPKKIILNWHITSPSINLGEYLAFLGKRRSGKATRTNAAAGRVFEQLDLVLDQANAHILLKVNRLIYKNFTADKIVSDITLKRSGIEINKVSLSHAGGTLQVSGRIDQSGTVNKIYTNSRITNVNVQKLFSAFDNFGQDAITAQNLRGVFFGSTKVSANMLDNGQMVPRSFHGTISFDLRNGSLVNFEPMEKIGKFAFPKRDFSNITFRNLKNTLEIRGNKVIIPPMQIETSVLNIFASGVYSFTTGTNITLEVPLRNPRKDAFLSDSLKETRVRKGIVLNLSAVDGDDGNVKIKLGKKAAKDADR